MALIIIGASNIYTPFNWSCLMLTFKKSSLQMNHRDVDITWESCNWS